MTEIPPLTTPSPIETFTKNQSIFNEPITQAVLEYLQKTTQDRPRNDNIRINNYQTKGLTLDIRV